MKIISDSSDQQWLQSDKRNTWFIATKIGYEFLHISCITKCVVKIWKKDPFELCYLCRYWVWYDHVIVVRGYCYKYEICGYVTCGYDLTVNICYEIDSLDGKNKNMQESKFWRSFKC